ncbi:hypothetical protein D9758_004134 [Tetrapyrgos nigripes]|uniref:Uncharacterized protein n=1 Tax=Tetrapyrgos nigripes TaxID=182062 RepID=A0A8H5GTT2_9AGAR|nr:hypothetical protein D9758_004134 [Tetrapyrgos nigripes]
MGPSSYPNPSKTTGAAEIFFPITEANFRDMQHKLNAADWYEEYHDSSQLINRLKNAADDAAHLVVTRVEFIQRRASPRHEFLVVFYKDVNSPGCQGHVIIERTRLDYARDKIDREHITDIEPEDEDERGGPLSSGTPASSSGWTLDFSRIASSLSHSSSSSSESLSSSSRKQWADDTLRVSYTNNYVDFTKKGCKLLAELDFTNPSTARDTSTRDSHGVSVSMGEILVITSLVHRRAPRYQLRHSQCYYYARMIWHLINAIAGERVEIKQKKKRHFKLFYIVKREMQKKVEEDAPGLSAEFEKDWKQFKDAVECRRKELDHPRLVAEIQREQALKEREVASLERDRALREVARLESELAAIRSPQSQAY